MRAPRHPPHAERRLSLSQQDERNRDGQRRVLYVYRCQACRHRGEVRLPDDSHDGEAVTCSACGGPVTLEWDGGVTFQLKGG